MTEYLLTNTGSNGKALRSGSNVTFATKPHSNVPASLLTSAGYITPNTKVIGNEIITLSDVVKNSQNTVVGLVGDKWLHVIKIMASDGTQYQVDGYTAIIHMGINQTVNVVEFTSPNPTPEPVPSTDLVDVVIEQTTKTVIVRGKLNTAWKIEFQDQETLTKARLK